MKRSCHCHPAQQAPTPAGKRRGREFLKLLLPTTALLLLPKCPVCVAGYVALLTGLSIPLPIADGLRISLIVLCVGSLVYMLLTRTFASGQSWRR